MKEIYLGGWITSLMVLIAICSIGGTTDYVGIFIGIMGILAVFGCFIRAMMIFSFSGKKSIDWMALGYYVIGAAISVAVPAIILMFVCMDGYF